MLVVLSPAKALDFTPLETPCPHSQPVFSDQTAHLAALVRRLSPGDIKALMGLSDALADLNHARFQNFAHEESQQGAKQAALAFNGDTYSGLDAATLSQNDLLWGQEHMRILSGLYGVLRPLDLIEPYRLEMGLKLATERGKDLYAFWKGLIAAELDRGVASHEHPIIINCASVEYFKAAEEKTTLRAPVITPVFREERNDTSRVIGIMAKRARGMMARFILTNRLEYPEQIKTFSAGGYRFKPEHSDAHTWVFTRPHP